MRIFLVILFLACSLSGCSYYETNKNQDTFSSSIIHTSSRTFYEYIFLCSDNTDDMTAYTTLLSGGYDCKKDPAEEIICDIKCNQISGYIHHYSLSGLHLSFSLRYDNVSSAYDFLVSEPLHHLFTISGTTIYESNMYAIYGDNKTYIQYKAIKDGEGKEKILNSLQTKGYFVEPYDSNPLGDTLDLYRVSDRFLQTNKMPEELVYVFSKEKHPYYYIVSNSILLENCDNAFCSSFSDIQFFLE